MSNTRYNPPSNKEFKLSLDNLQRIIEKSPKNRSIIEKYWRFNSAVDVMRALARGGRFGRKVANRYTLNKYFSFDQLDQICSDFISNRYDEWRGRSLAKPAWFDMRVDPKSTDYRDQMLRLWCEITGRSNYNPAEHEDTPEIADADSLIRPAFYGSSDLKFAGAQLIAMGHIVMRSGVVAGDRVLEYGAGFGQTALALARLGAKVDTVDINPAFCKAVKRSAEHFLADLTPHHGEFGYNPAHEKNAYKLVFFYESFHHCLDFQNMIRQLPSLLAPGGRVILAGEPIFRSPCAEMPYPWGFRLDWENVAVMRHRGWMELGFQHDFLLDQFAESGFQCKVYTDPNSHWATIYEFQQ